MAEAALYQHPQLRRTLPPLHRAVRNVDEAVVSRSGYVFPPFIVLERGVTLQVRLLDALSMQSSAWFHFPWDTQVCHCSSCKCGLYTPSLPHQHAGAAAV